MRELPNGWAEAKLTDFCHIEMGQAPPSSSYNNEGIGLPLYQGKAEFGELFPTPRKYCSEPSKVGAKGSILLSVRAPVGPTNIAPHECAIGRGLSAILPMGGIPNRFILWGLRAQEAELAKAATGSTFAAISKSEVISIPFKLPPLNEQRRIVERIETHFDEIDKGVESLQAAKNTLGLYQQSLLKSAFEGRLTADWREKNADKLESPEALFAMLEEERSKWHEQELERWREDIAEWGNEGSKGPKPRKIEAYKTSTELTDAERDVLPKLPTEWIYVRLNDIAHIGSGMSVSKARKLENPIETPYLRVANVQRGRLNLAEIKTMPVERSQLKTLSLRTWDILFNEGGDRDKLGRGWIWEDQVEICITQNHVFRATPFRHDRSWSLFVSQWGNSYGRDYFEAGGKQTTNLASINKSVLKALPVPVCSPSEQAEIVRLLDEKFEAADALKVEIDAGLARAAALRQSILKKALSGQLVSQDPTDEPASELLARIKVEKAEKERTAKRERKTIASRKSKAKVRRPTLTNLIEVLKEQNGWISASKAAQELGVFDGASSDDVEAFYRQLKEHLQNKDETIKVERRGDEDWLRLAKAEVS